MSSITRDPSPSLAAARSAGGSVRAWLILWFVVVGVLVALLSFHGRLDQFTWCATRWAVGDRDYYVWTEYQAAHAADPERPFYAVFSPPFHSGFYKSTSNLWLVLKTCGEPWMIFIMTLFVASYRRHWLTGGAFALAVSLPAGLAMLIRVIDGRYRPNKIDGAWKWELFRGFHDGTDLAFPSGHATAAFAAAAALAYLWPKGRWFFMAVAAGTALSRVVAGAHFYSDAIFGAALGWTLSWFTMVFLDRWYNGPIRTEIPAGTPRQT